MFALNRLARATALAACLAATPALAQSASDGQSTVDHAVGTLQDLRHDKEFGTAKQLVPRARAIMIAPSIFRAGFFVGGEGGNAALLVRGRGGFSDPAFETIASASFGLQIGAQESEMIVFIMNDRALHAIMRNHFKIGADAGLAIATLGTLAGGATTSHAGPDVIVWASSSGAYAGISLNGSVIEPNTSVDATYYGPGATTASIVHHKTHSAAAAALVSSADGLL